MSDISLASDIHSRLDEYKIVTLEGEVWSARDIMAVAGYAAWQDFSRAVDRAIASVNASGLDASDHFRGVPKMVAVGSGAQRQVEDVELTRYGCYILFQNADSRKPEIAAMQQYFAVQTRRQELAPAPKELSRLEILTLALESETRAIAAETQLAIVEPKAQAYDRIAGSSTLVKVEVAARKAGLGRTTAFEMLRRAGIFSVYGNTPLARYAHRFEEVPAVYVNSRGETITTFTTKVRTDSFDWLVTTLETLKGKATA